MRKDDRWTHSRDIGMGKNMHKALDSCHNWARHLAPDFPGKIESKSVQ